MLDTNVLVSGLFAHRGTLAKLLDLWQQDRFEVAVSVAILAEIDRTLHKSSIRKHFKVTEKEITDYLETIVVHAAVITEDTLEIDIIKKDPSDNKFLACAKEAEAGYIVSGDKHLLDLQEYQGISILTAAQFVKTIK